MLGFGANGPKSERQRKKRKPNRPPGGGGEKSLSSGRFGAQRPGTALYSLCAPKWERIIDLPRRWGLSRSAFSLLMPKCVGGVGASGPRRASQTFPLRCCRASGRVLVTPDICAGFAVNVALCYTEVEPNIKGRRRYQRPGPVGNLIPAGHQCL